MRLCGTDYTRRGGVMSQHWFCAVGGQQSGPVDEAQVRQMVMDRRLGPEDLAWREGMAEWAPVRMIPDLAPLAAGPYAQPAVAAPVAPFAPMRGIRTGARALRAAGSGARAGRNDGAARVRGAGVCRAGA